ncbi:MAG: NAD(P)/FAD-dependent oxidoreductase [Bacteroidetes bacterium]|nr:NAD(P)/FAD-dependent oxidoreductase [Bacteroidota bacterium]MBS1972805.1 NAD(P)/FAD-dependent oxidoreductase [Bacteroidota bacterium]
MPKTLIVIGGGAAGFFCAVNAARMGRGLKVIVLEKSSKPLSKVKVSGGGRCNVTHACADIDEMAKSYPRGQHFVKKTFHQFSAIDTIEWFKERGVMLKTEEDGRMFPVTDSSQTIVDGFFSEANKYGVELLLNCEVHKVEKSGNIFHVAISGSRLLASDFLCIATGGYPKPSMFGWMIKLGHHIIEPAPSLFTFNLPNNPVTKLMGVSVQDVHIKIVGSKTSGRGPVLITHWGLSGPAVLRSSAWGAKELASRNYEFGITLNWLPGYNEHTMKEEFRELRNQHGPQKIIKKNQFGLPQRLWQYFLQQSGITENMRWADLPAKPQNMLIQNLLGQHVEVKGKTVFKEEFVTAGGIELSEIDANTMQSKVVPNLFFAGEVMDVDGITGGFNFQHAWTSGFIAAKSIVSAAW